MTVPPGSLSVATLLGVATLAMSLIWPRTFFPLCWGAALLIADPFVYRRRPELSLIADLERGDWGRVARLMLGGLGVGLLWEGYNYWARGKWVYTVPWLEDTKWFEMPPFGFAGFPVFALSAWALYHALCSAGVAVPTGAPTSVRPVRTGLATILAGTFAFVTLSEMDRVTVSSTVPTLAHLHGMSVSEVAVLESAGIYSPFELAIDIEDPATLTVATGLVPERATALLETARLTTLQGIGALHAAQLKTAGVPTVCALASTDPHELWVTIHALFRGGGRRPTRPEVRVWQRAAERECRLGGRG